MTNEDMTNNDISTIASLIAALLEVHVLVWDSSTGAEADAKEAVFASFEHQYCFHPSLQPFYTAAHMKLLAQSAKQGCLYGLTDDLGTSLLLFRYHAAVFACGPYVKAPCNQVSISKLLADAGLSASYASQLTLCLTQLPILTTDAVLRTCEGCLAVFDPDRHYTSRVLHSMRETGRDTTEVSSLPHAVSETYSEIYARYELENHFQERITAGDAEGAVQAYLTLSTHHFPKEITDAYLFFHDYGSGLSSIRTLARKAAERGGLSVIEIDRIMRETEQKLRKVTWKNQIQEIIIDMVRSLAEKVRAAQQESAGCSPEIRRCLEYLSLHYADPVRLADLARIAGISESRLSTRFKEETGSTVSAYLMAVRLREGAELLKKTDLPVQEISSYVGYPDSSYFVRVFRKHWGMTPTEYRRAGSTVQESRLQ